MTQSKRPTETPSTESAKNEPPKSEPAKSEARPPQTGWVLAPGSEPFSREELLARYRRQRGLPETLSSRRQAEPAAGYRDKIMSQPRPAARFIAPDPELLAAAAAAPQRPSLSLGQTFAVAAAMALAAGAGVGMVNAKFFQGNGTQAAANLAASPAPVQAATVVTTPPELKPVSDGDHQEIRADGDTRSG